MDDGFEAEEKRLFSSPNASSAAGYQTNGTDREDNFVRGGYYMVHEMSVEIGKAQEFLELLP